MHAIFKTIIFTLIVPVSVTVGLPYLLMPSGVALFPMKRWSLSLVGIIPIVLGAVFYLQCAWDFAFTGKGTPAPFDPPKTLVWRGWYRIVRNPMYFGVLLILFGESILFQSWTLLQVTFFVWLFFHLFVIFYEEPHLQKTFGASYENYRKTVPRWIPHLKRSKRSR